VTETGMTALLGGDSDEVQTALKNHGLTPANMNSAGQVVAAGTLEDVAGFEHPFVASFFRSRQGEERLRALPAYGSH